MHVYYMRYMWKKDAKLCELYYSQHTCPVQLQLISSDVCKTIMLCYPPPPYMQKRNSVYFCLPFYLSVHLTANFSSRYSTNTYLTKQFFTY